MKLLKTDYSGLISEVKNFQLILQKFPQLVYAGDKILRIHCDEINKEDFQTGRVKRWSNLMETTLKDYRAITGYGRGLAGNQVGICKQIIVTFLNEKFSVYVNPKIVEESEEKAMMGELCLSFGLVMGDIVRPYWIMVEYLDVNGKKIREKMNGVAARLLQHEISHLMGKLCLDESVPLSLRLIRKGKEEVFGEKLKILKEV